MSLTKSATLTRGGLLERLSEARERTDELFAIVRKDSLYHRPIAERHRIVFYIGHLEAFDWNLLTGRLLDLSSSRPDLDRLFAFGIDPVDGGLPKDQPSDWPSLTVVREYVQRVRDELDEGISRDLGDGEGRPREFASSLLLNVAIEHRLMHAETLSYMLHQLPFEKKIAPGISLQFGQTSVTPEMVDIPAGPITLGLARDGGVFGWDNEFERNTVEVPEFAIDRRKVTNRQYLEFFEAGGYQNRALWSEVDWNWKGEGAISHPAFWILKDGQWFWRAMFEEVPLPPEWPVYVSHAEASAYARWVGKSLPTEEQWQRAAYGSAIGEVRQYPWGAAHLSSDYGNFNFENWDPVAVGDHPAGSSAFGVEDILGNGWEWTSTVFQPFQGFEAFPFYRGYSADFFDGKHYVLKGGSARTAACMLRPSFRNWFQAHYQYVYSGFRCVSNRLA